MFTIYTFLVDNEKVVEEEEEKLQQRWRSWFKMIAIKPRRDEEEQKQKKKPESAQGEEK